MTMSVLLAVDGTNLLHRGYHALKETGLSNPAGEPVWALHGLTVNIVKVLRTRRYDALVVCFDVRGGCPARRALNDQYKANRSAPDETLRLQLDAAPQLLRAAGVSVWTQDGWEADDGLASLAAWSEQHNWECDIVSSDRDLYQVVSDGVHVVKPEGVRFDTRQVIDKTGVSPARYPHMAAMRGEPGDNLDGIRGIGPKTAAKLLEVHPDLQTALTDLAALAALVGKANAAKLESGLDIYTRNLEIGRLRQDLPVEDEIAGGRIPADSRHILAAYEQSGLPAAGKQLATELGRAR
jgi:DNA polymerase-1